MVRRILWVDDEIELLKAHVMFLEQKGYEVTTAASGGDAVDLVSRRRFDIVLLDESMPGMGGLETLARIRDLDATLPVVMITKNEEERLMQEAIGRSITDYLLKPVNPLQIHSALTRILDAERIRHERLSPDYIREFNEINELAARDTWDGWVQVHRRLCAWDREFDTFRESGLVSTHHDQRLDCARRFGEFVRASYRDWVHSEDRPPMSPDVVARHVAPALREGRQTFLVVIDCVRLDQWLVIEEFLREDFDVEWSFYASILPTATPYARNAIFAGLFPDEIARRYPDRWAESGSDESSLNRHEAFLLGEQLARLGLEGVRPRYHKVYSADEAEALRRRIAEIVALPFAALVFNFVDMLTHGRNQSEILRQLLPDEGAFRSLMRSWYAHSVLRDILSAMARSGAHVVLTSDHGSILGRRATIVQGRRDTSSNLRYKIGENLKTDPGHAIIVRNPQEYRLPAESKTKNYLFALEYYYFVYPTNHREYEKQFEGTFQHGGVSLEEMVLPCLTLRPRGTP